MRREGAGQHYGWFGFRAAIADDPDSGVLIMSQHGGCIPGAEGMKADRGRIA